MKPFATHDERTATIHGAWQDAPDPVYRTLVAWNEQGLCGVGTLWEHSLHPARWRVTMHGSEAFWSGGGATAMLDDLRARRPDRRLLQTGLPAGEQDRYAFWQRQGFSLLMRTRRGFLTLGIVPAPVNRDIAITTQRLTTEGYRLSSLAELGDREQLRQHLARLHATVYAQGHQWNPVRALTDEEARYLFMDPDEVIPDTMVVALQGEDLVAVSSLRRTADATQVELGWTGVLPDHAAQREDLIVALVGRCLHHAKGENWGVLVEVDEADETL